MYKCECGNVKKNLTEFDKKVFWNNETEYQCNNCGLYIYETNKMTEIEIIKHKNYKKNPNNCHNFLKRRLREIKKNNLKNGGNN